MGMWSGGPVGGANRQGGFNINVSIDMGNLPTLPERMTEYLVAALTFHLQDACEVVIHRAQAKLLPLGHAPGEITGPHVDRPGGLDSGKLQATLKYELAHEMAAGIVAYDLLSDDAEYWQWIEFGHWVAAQKPWFWQGYHMLASAIAESIPAIRRSVKRAWEDTAIKLASESSPDRAGALSGMGMHAGTSPRIIGR
jgi:hypothetical protein